MMLNLLVAYVGGLLVLGPSLGRRRLRRVVVWLCLLGWPIVMFIIIPIEWAHGVLDGWDQ